MPAFGNVKRQLEGLEDRLEGMVQPRLADAITQRKVGILFTNYMVPVAFPRYSSFDATAIGAV